MLNFKNFLAKNPFGFSSTNLGSLYKGLEKDAFANFKHLRKTKHTHNPVDDAMGNAEALLHMKEVMGPEDQAMRSPNKRLQLTVRFR